MGENAKGPILLAEDDEGCRLVLTDILEERGYEVLPARDGEEALELFVAKRPPVVVTDVKMPKMDGETLFARIREISPRTRVILVTALATVEAATRMMRQGAVDYLEKPVNADRLAEVVGGALQSILDGDPFSLEDFRDWKTRMEAEFKHQVEQYRQLALQKEMAARKTAQLVQQIQQRSKGLEEELARVRDQQATLASSPPEGTPDVAEELARRDRRLEAARGEIESLKDRLADIEEASWERGVRMAEARLKKEIGRRDGRIEELLARCRQLERAAEEGTATLQAISLEDLQEALGSVRILADLLHTRKQVRQEVREIAGDLLEQVDTLVALVAKAAGTSGPT